MSSRWLTPAFYMWLSEHSELIPFIEIDSFSSKTDPAKIREYEELRKTTVAALLDFSTNQLVVTEPEIADVQIPGPDSAKIAVFQYHVLCFVQHAIYDEQLLSFNAALSTCSSLVGLLQSDDIQKSINLKLDLPALFRHMLGEGKRTLCLRFKYQELAANYAKNISATATLKILIDITNRLIKTCATQMDRDSAYLYPNNADQRLQQILLCSASPLREEYLEIMSVFNMEERSAFTAHIVEYFDRVADVLQVTDPFEQGILIILLIRSIFSSAYAINPEFFYRKKPKKILDPRKISFTAVCGDDDGTEEDRQKTIYEVFGGSKFAEARKHVDFATFYINPIDALFEMHEVIGIIQMIVSRQLGYENSMVLPFEQLFGPLVGVILSSDVSDLFGLGDFIIDFSPAYRLCPELEFTLVTLQAVFKFISSLEEDVV